MKVNFSEYVKPALKAKKIVYADICWVAVVCKSYLASVDEANKLPKPSFA